MKKIISVVLSAALLISGVLFLSACNKTEDETTTEAPTEESTAAPLPTNINPLTGIGGYDESKADAKPICIVVENSPAARPQWGMSTPDILIEYEVEGGISRMLWLYANETLVPDKVGPVRSARHDIVELVLGLDGVFVHAGASVFAKDAIEKYSATLQELDGNTLSSCFERDTSRDVGTEHTLCLIGDSFRTAIIEKNLNTVHTQGYVNPFVFSSEGTPVTLANDAQSIDFRYSSSYKYTFKYDSATGKYNCELNSAARMDADDIQCAYNNVLVLYVDMIDMQTSSGHQDLQLENGGRGVYLNGGKYEEISWTKGAQTDNLKLFNAAGEQLVMNPGNTYIGLVRSTLASSTTIA